LFLAGPAGPSHHRRIAPFGEGEMPLVVALNLLVQVCFVVHAYRSGAPRYWVFVILAFPVVGCLAYFFLEVFPHAPEARAARATARRLAKALDPDRGLREKAADLALCGSIDNRVALAEECLAAGMPVEAVMLYRSSLTGAYENDPHLRFGLARALIEQGAWDDAAQAVARLRKDHPCHRPNETRLLRARVLEATGETGTALGEYHELVPVFVGLEARLRYGLLLERLGRAEAARMVFEEALAVAKRNPAPIETEARWAKLARDRLATTAQA
jgi:hypothetical protein